MKIAIVSDAWRPQTNGVVQTLSTTAQTLRAGGHDVLVIEPSQFRTFPCPTYPEIRLALLPYRRLAQLRAHRQHSGGRGVRGNSGCEVLTELRRVLHVQPAGCGRRSQTRRS